MSSVGQGDLPKTHNVLQRTGKVVIIKAVKQRSFLAPHGERSSVALFPLFYCGSATTDNFSYNLDACHLSPGETSGLSFIVAISFILSLRGDEKKRLQKMVI